MLAKFLGVGRDGQRVTLLTIATVRGGAGLSVGAVPLRRWDFLFSETALGTIHDLHPVIRRERPTVAVCGLPRDMDVSDRDNSTAAAALGRFESEIHW
jgi:hypothetical protein